MWINKRAYEFLLDSVGKSNLDSKEWRDKLVAISATRERLEIENARLRADLDWFKLRLNQVERERGQLIQAAIGVKVSIPEFVPKMDNPEEAFNAMPDLSTVGNDAHETWDDDMTSVQSEIADYSRLPGYRKQS